MQRNFNLKSKIETIQDLCYAVRFYKYDAVKKIIEVNKISPNDFDPDTKLRPVDEAAIRGNIDMLELLLSLNAKLFLTQKQKSDQINNILFNTCLCDNLRKRKDTLNWLLQSDKLILLNKDGIQKEHILAALGLEKSADANAEVEDAEGVLPAYYAALIGSENLKSWLPENLKTNFLNNPIQKGLYQNTTGAWWSCFSYDEMEKFIKKPIGEINLFASPIYGHLAGVTIFNLIVRSDRGRNFLMSLPDEIFNNINWNMNIKSIRGLEASTFWFVADGWCEEIKRFMKLPYNKLSQINWNESPSQKSTIACEIVKKMKQV